MVTSTGYLLDNASPLPSSEIAGIRQNTSQRYHLSIPCLYIELSAIRIARPDDLATRLDIKLLVDDILKGKIVLTLFQSRKYLPS
jgi:hypothetical protein